MPSITYMNQSAPFWDFIASIEQEGRSHPLFNQINQNQDESAQYEQAEDFHPFGPWGWGYPRGFPFRSPPPHGPPPHGPPPFGPPPHSPPHHEHERGEDNGLHERDFDTDFEKDFEKELEKEIDKEKGVENNDNGEGPSKSSGSETEGHGCRRGGRHGRWGGRFDRHEHGFGPREHWGREHHHHGPPGPCGRGGRRGFGGRRHGPPDHGPHHHGRRGGWGPWAGRGGPFGGGPPFDPFAFAASFFESASGKDDNKGVESQDFTPEADIFDTSSSFVIHVSLPGAKKEDVGVNWDAEKSELSIAGVIYRPGDEEFIKTLAMDERKVGPFERKIRLGTRANPAQIDAEGISAKLEDGILRVEVPKMETEFVEIRKVDIE